MRATWTGAITFGLVNVPVKVFSATQDHDVRCEVVGETGRRSRRSRCGRRRGSSSRD